MYIVYVLLLLFAASLLLDRKGDMILQRGRFEWRKTTTTGIGPATPGEKVVLAR